MAGWLPEKAVRVEGPFLAQRRPGRASGRTDRTLLRILAPRKAGGAWRSREVLTEAGIQERLGALLGERVWVGEKWKLWKGFRRKEVRGEMGGVGPRAFVLEAGRQAGGARGEGRRRADRKSGRFSLHETIL